MKVRFLLKKKSKDQNSGLIYLALYLQDGVELISTGQRILEKDWSTKDQFPKQHLGTIAKAINDVKAGVDKAVIRLQAKEIPITPFAIKQEYQAHSIQRISQQIQKDQKIKENKKSVKKLAESWLETDLFKYQKSTQKAVKESINQFIEFLDKTGNSSIEKADLDSKLITAYEKYLQDTKQLANSTHGKRMKHLRWFLKSIQYDVSAIKIRTSKKEIIALTQEEIVALEEATGINSEQQKAKDLFLLGCYTGLRISDLKRLDQTRIINNRICMTLQKNKREVVIPVSPKAKVILEKYGMRSPRITEQVLNRCIKEVCAIAKIETILTVRKNIAGRNIDEVIPKHKLITSHTASKTFISLAPEWYDMSPAEVAVIVGKDLKTLLNHYFNLPRESAIKKMENQ